MGGYPSFMVTSSKAVYDHQNLLEMGEGLVMDSIAETMDLYGVTPSIGRLYSILYFNEGPLSLDEMSERTGMSKPSMSTGIHALLEIFMVQKVWMKGVRKDQYVAEKDFFQSFIQFFCKKWEREILLNVKSIESATDIFHELLHDKTTPSSIRQKAEANLKQLEESRKYYEWLVKLVEAFRSKEIFTLIK